MEANRIDSLEALHHDVFGCGRSWWDGGRLFGSSFFMCRVVLFCINGVRFKCERFQFMFVLKPVESATVYESRL